MDPQGFNEQRLTQYIEEFQREQQRLMQAMVQATNTDEEKPLQDDLRYINIILNNLLNARSKKRKASERTA